MLRLSKAFYRVTGCICAAIGAVGAVVPLLPAFPFLLLAATCFAKGSEKLRAWFVGTRLYRKHFERFARQHGMTRAAKVRVMAGVTLVMAVGLIMMVRKGQYVPCMILSGVWLCHGLYFCFGMRTLPDEER